MKYIKIYTSPSCGYCMRAKELLTSLGMQFEEKNLFDNPEEADALSEKHNWRTVPMIFIDDVFIGGYDELAAMHKRGELVVE